MKRFGRLSRYKRVMFARALLLPIVLGLSLSSLAGPISEESKAEVLRQVNDRVTKAAFVPGIDFSSWPKIAEGLQPRLQKASTEEEFAAILNEGLASFKQSHLQVISPELNRTRRAGIRAGIGVMGEATQEGLKLTMIAKNSPAEKAGLLVGDVLLEVNGVKPTGLSALAGDVGAEFELKVKRSTGYVEKIKLKREIYSTRQPETLSWPIAKKVAVLRIPTFEESYNSKKIAELVEEAKHARMLIVDLRGNPGGFVFNMLHAAAHLLPDNSVLGTMAYRYGMERFTKETGKPSNDLKGYAEWTEDKLRPFRLNPPQKPFSGTISVLVDGSTGSAAEMLAQALRENSAARVFGQKSAGQVLLATITPVGKGFTMIVPMQDYISLKGVRLEGTGVLPDVLITESNPKPGIDRVLESALEYAQTLPGS